MRKQHIIVIFLAMISFLVFSSLFFLPYTLKSESGNPNFVPIVNANNKRIEELKVQLHQAIEEIEAIQSLNFKDATASSNNDNDHYQHVQQQKSNVFVTGSPRSGTTWVGKTLSESSDIDSYVHEPFNYIHSAIGRDGGEMCQGYATRDSNFLATNKTKQPIQFPFKYQFKYLTADSHDLKTYSDWVDFVLLDCGRFLFKDPIAFFSAEWIEEAYNASVVVTIRHPVEVVTSWLNLNHYNTLKQHASIFNSQPQLLSRFPHISVLLDEFQSIIDQDNYIETSKQGLIFLWKVFFVTTLDYMEKHKDWVFIFHDQVKANPQASFSAVFERLGLHHQDIPDSIYAKKAQGIDKIKDFLPEEYPIYSYVMESLFHDQVNTTTKWPDDFISYFHHHYL